MHCNSFYSKKHDESLCFFSVALQVVDFAAGLNNTFDNTPNMYLVHTYVQCGINNFYKN